MQLQENSVQFYIHVKCQASVTMHVESLFIRIELYSHTCRYAWKSNPHLTEWLPEV